MSMQGSAEAAKPFWRVVLALGMINLLVASVTTAAFAFRSDQPTSQEFLQAWATGIGIGTFASFLLMPLAGAAAELVGARWILIIGIAALLGGTAMLKLSQSPATLMAGAGLWAVAIAAVGAPLLMAFAAQRVGTTRRSAAMLAVAIAPLIGNGVMLAGALLRALQDPWAAPSGAARIITGIGMMLDRSGGPIFATQWPWESLAVAGVLLALFCLLAGGALRPGLRGWKGKVSAALSERSIWLMLAGFLLAGAATFSMGLLVTFMMQMGLSTADAASMVPVYHAGGLVGLAIVLLARRARFKRMLIAAALLQGLVLIGFAFLPPTIGFLRTLHFFFGVSALTILPIAACLVERRMGATGLPTLVGALWTAQAFGSSFGQVAAGQLDDAVGPPGAFLCGAIACVAAALIYLGIREEAQPSLVAAEPAVAGAAAIKLD